MRKTDKELLEALSPLEDKMTRFTTTGGGSLGSGEVQLLSQLYLDLQERAQGQLPRTFCTSCSTQIRDAFTIFSSWYNRTKGDIEAAEQEQTIEIVTDIIKKKTKKK